MTFVFEKEKFKLTANRFLLQMFSGNSNRDDIVQHVLVEVARAQIIRFQPIDYHIHKALRVEVNGIKIPAGTSVFHL